MKTYYSNDGSVYGVDFSESKEGSFMIHKEDPRRITLEKGTFKSDFIVNQGDEFYEHNSLVYIKIGVSGDIISAHDYDWDNSLVRDGYDVFREMFGNCVQAVQINQHAKLLEI